jgi:hypothetical protein
VDNLDNKENSFLGENDDLEEVKEYVRKEKDELKEL